MSLRDCLTSVSFTVLPPLVLEKKKIPPCTSVILWRGESVRVPSWPIPLFYSFATSLHLAHTHVTPPRPALMLAILFVGEWRLLLSETELSSAGTGRTEGSRSSQDKPAALRSGPPLGRLPHQQRPEASFPLALHLSGLKNTVYISFIGLASSSASPSAGLQGPNILRMGADSVEYNTGQLSQS